MRALDLGMSNIRRRPQRGCHPSAQISASRERQAPAWHFCGVCRRPLPSWGSAVQTRLGTPRSSAFAKFEALVILFCACVQGYGVEHQHGNRHRPDTPGDRRNGTGNLLGRVKIDVGIRYDQDLLKAKRVLEAVMTEDARVKTKPGPMVYVLNLVAGAVELGGRCWVDNKDYWVARCELLEKAKLRFDQEGIRFAFAQWDLHLNPGEAMEGQGACSVAVSDSGDGRQAEPDETIA